MSETPKTLLLIDGFALAYKTFFGIPVTMTLADGQPINSVYGFVTTVLRAIEKYKPDYFCVCFDTKEPTFRHTMFPDYKAHRDPPPPEFISQIPLLKDIINKMGFMALEKPGFEADDLLGTLSKLGEDHNTKVLIMTGDQDAFQLVTDNVSVITTQRGSTDIIEYTPDKVSEKMNVTPAQVIDFKALKGDPSDNIPGVKGVGDKTASNLIQEFGTLENIYNSIEKIKSDSVKQKLITDKEKAFLSQELATIKRDVPLDKGMQDFSFSPDWPMILAGLQAYQFTQLVTKYTPKLTQEEHAEQAEISSVSAPDGHYTQLSLSDLKGKLSQLKQGFAIDLETTSTQAREAQIVGVALSVKPGEGWYIPCNAYVNTSMTSAGGALFQPTLMGSLFEEETQDYFQKNPVVELLKPILEDKSIPKYTHNGKYETIVFLNYGVALQGIAFDTMIAAFCVFPGERVGLKDLALRHLNIGMTHYEDVAGKGKLQIPFYEVPLDQATQYAAADADMTYRLKTFLEPKIAEKNVTELFYDIEMPIQDILSDMEFKGVALDSKYLATLEKEFEEKNNDTEAAIFELTQERFNLKSPKQLAEVLYEKMGLPVLKKTKTGASTDSSVLEKLKKDYPIAQLLVAYRTVEKLQSTYVKVLPTLVNPITNKIHTSFNQTIAITGRLSSTNPNLQNIPIRTEEGLKIRAAIIPSHPEGTILSIDYSQIELRVMAHMAKDQNMIRAFQKGEDIHKATAAHIHNIPIEEVTKEQRYNAKAVNFGIIYGISAFGLSENINVTRSEAKAIITTYFETFPGIKTFMDDTIAFAREHGMVTTMFGRMRPLPEINDRIKSRQQFSERTAINTRVQGTAAEILKKAMIQVASAIKEAKLKSNMVIQVHDELVFDCVPGEQDQLIQLVKQNMESAVKLSVPLTVDVESGKNWKDLH